MASVEAQFKELRVLSLTLPVFAIAITLFRLCIRAHRRQLWWDDFWAMAAVLCTVLFVTAMELHFRDESSYSRTTKIALYYMLSQFFYAINWCSKLSILSTSIRLTTKGRFRNLLITAGCMFVLTWTILFSQVFWVCERQPGWKDTPQPQCDLGRNVAIAQVISDVLTDAILIAAPLKLIWRVKLTRPRKTRIVVVFSSTIIATVVSLYHAYAILRFGGFVEARAAVIQDGVSLIVADLSVLVAFFGRLGSIDDSRGAVRTGPMELKYVTQPYKTGTALTVHVDTETIFQDFHNSDTSRLAKAPSNTSLDTVDNATKPKAEELCTQV
ncbi:hypothetical protein OE88DRAFT_1740163 [Heliocybe sulcata]|uniref:Rhodopsin domain-containing protein n=1 Tax=Heliocybe sulcata TaxID=5364 RepID=A0A5C3MJI3_9AGAM|nr:hypothetical protein OE88DRAFT_1740163 [Heliocybe sulcata]